MFTEGKSTVGKKKCLLKAHRMFIESFQKSYSDSYRFPFYFHKNSVSYRSNVILKKSKKIHREESSHLINYHPAKDIKSLSVCFGYLIAFSF